MSHFQSPSHSRSVLPVDVDPLAHEAVRLRTQGHSYAAISALIGRNTNWVREALRRAADVVLEDKREYVLRQLGELEHLKERIMVRYREMDERIGRMAPISDKDVSAFVRVQEREARLLGLDQPASVKLAVALDGRSDEELAQLAIANGIETILADATSPTPPDPVSDGTVDAN